jgi:hypothetical protein
LEVFTALNSFVIGFLIFGRKMAVRTEAKMVKVDPKLLALFAFGGFVGVGSAILSQRPVPATSAEARNNAFQAAAGGLLIGAPVGAIAYVVLAGGSDA